MNRKYWNVQCIMCLHGIAISMLSIEQISVKTFCQHFFTLGENTKLTQCYTKETTNMNVSVPYIYCRRTSFKMYPGGLE